MRNLGLLPSSFQEQKTKTIRCMVHNQLNNGKSKKFQATNWIKLLEDKVFRESVLEIMDDAVVRGIKLEE
jgi:hypothetical protein